MDKKPTVLSPVDELLLAVRRVIRNPPRQETEAENEFDRGKVVGWNEAIAEIAAGLEAIKRHE